MNEPIERLLSSSTSGHLDSRQSRFAYGLNERGRPFKGEPKDCEKNASSPFEDVRRKMIGEAVKFNKS